MPIAGRVTLSERHRHGRLWRQVDLPYVPSTTRWSLLHLGEEPILNNVPTYVIRKPEDLATPGPSWGWWSRSCLVLNGYGMLVGPASEGADRTFRQYLDCHPAKIHRLGQKPFELSDLCHWRRRRVTWTCAPSSCPEPKCRWCRGLTRRPADRWW